MGFLFMIFAVIVGIFLFVLGFQVEFTFLKWVFVILGICIIIFAIYSLTPGGQAMIHATFG